MTRFQSGSNLQRATNKAHEYQRRVEVAERNRELARLAKQAAEQAERDREAQRIALGAQGRCDECHQAAQRLGR